MTSDGFGLIVDFTDCRCTQGASPTMRSSHDAGKVVDVRNRVLSVGLVTVAMMQAPTPACPQSAPGAGKPNATAAKADAAEKRAAARLLLDPKLFTPDDRYTYDGSDKYDRPKARFGGAIVGQKGSVSIGDNRWLNTGAYVLYQVWRYPSLKEAIAAFRLSTTYEKPGKLARRTVRQLKAGDEGRELLETVANERGEPVIFNRRAHVRFGTYLLAVTSSTDMKSFGPRPASGPRLWLSQPVFDKVLPAALNRCAAIAKVRPAGK